MKVSVILAHPTAGSFNHAIASKAVKALKQNGHDVIFHDLYQERFDPLLTGAEFARRPRCPPRFKDTAGRSPRPTGSSSSTRTGGANPLRS